MLLSREVLPPRPALAWRIVAQVVAIIPGAVVASFFGLVLWALTKPCYMCHGESKVDIARATVKTYAFEAYPSWQQANPGRTCPSSVLELNPWMNNKDARDPWGGGYVIRCDTPSLGVFSAGEDGIFGTADDIKSWE
jgi:hypothetical protein